MTPSSLSLSLFLYVRAPERATYVDSVFCPAHAAWAGTVIAAHTYTGQVELCTVLFCCRSAVAESTAPSIEAAAAGGGGVDIESRRTVNCAPN